MNGRPAIAGFLWATSATLPGACSACGQFGRVTARCSVKVNTASTRRRHRVTINVPNLNNYSTDFLDELRRLIRSPSFISRVRERIKWPYFLFSGVLFARMPDLVTVDGSDGHVVPEGIRQLASRVDIRLIHVPPLLVERAAATTKQPLPDGRHVRIVAVFETYGHARTALRELQNQRSQNEFDLQKQRTAWSDPRDTQRNETKINALHGADSFEDDYLDYYM